jgi:hypothetical protein
MKLQSLSRKLRTKKELQQRVPKLALVTHLCHSTISFAVMHNAAFLPGCGRV